MRTFYHELGEFESRFVFVIATIAFMFSAAIDDLLELLEIPGPPGEEAVVAAHLRHRLVRMGVPDTAITVDHAQWQSEYGGSTGNLIVHLAGTRGGTTRMFSAHMDTVPGAVGAIPRVDGSRIVNDAPGKALGGDNRTGCALLLHVARTLLARKDDHEPTTLAFFIQEEVGLVGARGLDASKLHAPAYCLNFDGYEAGVVITSVTGTERFTIDIEGVAAHSGMNPNEGISAGIIAARALAQLAGDGWHGAITKPDGRGSANMGILHGGTGSNVVMPELHILAEARSHDRAFRRRIIEQWQQSFAQHAAAAGNTLGNVGRVKFGPAPTYEAYALTEDAPVVQAVRAAGERIGLKITCISDDGGNDCNWIVAHGIPAVTIGCGQRHVHMPSEYVDLEDFAKACELAERLALGECT